MLMLFILHYDDAATLCLRLICRKMLRYADAKDSAIMRARAKRCCLSARMFAMPLRYARVCRACRQRLRACPYSGARAMPARRAMIRATARCHAAAFMMPRCYFAMSPTPPMPWCCFLLMMLPPYDFAALPAMPPCSRCRCPPWIFSDAAAAAYAMLDFIHTLYDADDYFADFRHAAITLASLYWLDIAFIIIFIDVIVINILFIAIVFHWILNSQYITLISLHTLAFIRWPLLSFTH